MNKNQRRTAGKGGENTLPPKERGNTLLAKESGNTLLEKERGNLQEPAQRFYQISR